jgi:hypothetical protein
MSESKGARPTGVLSNERVVWTGVIPNWMTADGGHANERPAEHRKRQLDLIRGRGWGGVSLVSQEPFGEAEVHIELADEGLHLLVYLPNTEGEEPALNAYLRADGLKVEEIHHSKDG